MKKLYCVLAFAVLLAPGSAHACAVCYGESDAPMAKGAALAILALGIVIASVLACVVAFFVHIKRKAAAQSVLGAPTQSV